MQWSIAKLATALGYTEPTIAMYERGYNSQGKPFSERTWSRLRTRCALIHDPDSTTPFNWGI